MAGTAADMPELAGGQEACERNFLVLQKIQAAFVSGNCTRKWGIGEISEDK
jgi:hypothetical protein